VLGVKRALQMAGLVSVAVLGWLALWWVLMGIALLFEGSVG